MGQGRPGRDRGGLRLLSDVRRDQSGFRYFVAQRGERGAAGDLSKRIHAFTFVESSGVLVQRDANGHCTRALRYLGAAVRWCTMTQMSESPDLSCRPTT